MSVGVVGLEVNRRFHEMILVSPYVHGQRVIRFYILLALQPVFILACCAS